MITKPLHVELTDARDEPPEDEPSPGGEHVPATEVSVRIAFEDSGVWLTRHEAVEVLRQLRDRYEGVRYMAQIQMGMSDDEALSIPTWVRLIEHGESLTISTRDWWLTLSGDCAEQLTQRLKSILWADASS